MTIECRICYVPHEPHGWIPPAPTAKSYRFLKEQCNVTGVRLQYLYDAPQWWDTAFQAAIGGGLEVHGNFCIADTAKVDPLALEARARVWAMEYAHEMKSVSFGNEPGYAFGDDDIAKGGTRDYMRELVGNFWLPFIRGVRRANPDIIIGGPDAESADTLQRFVDLVDVDRWFIHPYGEKEIADDGGLDYATMAGENGKLGFWEVISESGPYRQLIISEVDHQQHKAARARGELRGIATDAEIDQLTAFSVRMRDDFHAPVVTFGTGEYFCTRVPVQLPGQPLSTWSTLTYPEDGDPIMSDAGRRLAAVFAKPAPHIDMQKSRRRVVS